MEINTNFAVVKQKLIKTDEILRKFKLKENEAKELKIKHEALNTKCSSIKLELERLLVDKARINSKYEELLNKHEPLVKDQLELKQQYSVLENRFTSITRDLQNKYEATLNELNDSKKQIKKQEKTKQKEQKNEQTLSSEIGRLANENRILKHELEELKQKILDHEVEAGRMRKIQEELYSSKQELEAVRVGCKSHQDSIKSLTFELEQERKIRIDLENEVEGLKKQSDDYLQQIAVLKIKEEEKAEKQLLNHFEYIEKAEIDNNLGDIFEDDEIKNIMNEMILTPPVSLLASTPVSCTSSPVQINEAQVKTSSGSFNVVEYRKVGDINSKINWNSIKSIRKKRKKKNKRTNIMEALKTLNRANFQFIIHNKSKNTPDTSPNSTRSNGVKINYISKACSCENEDPSIVYKKKKIKRESPSFSRFKEQLKCNDVLGTISELVAERLKQTRNDNLNNILNSKEDANKTYMITSNETESFEENDQKEVTLIVPAETNNEKEKILDCEIIETDLSTPRKQESFEENDQKEVTLIVPTETNNEKEKIIDDEIIETDLNIPRKQKSAKSIKSRQTLCKLTSQIKLARELRKRTQEPEDVRPIRKSLRLSIRNSQSTDCDISLESPSKKQKKEEDNFDKNETKSRRTERKISENETSKGFDIDELIKSMVKTTTTLQRNSVPQLAILEENLMEPPKQQIILPDEETKEEISTDVIEEKPQLPPSKINVLFEKLVNFGNEEKAVNEVAKEFLGQSPEYIATVILNRIAEDKYDRPETSSTNNFTPILTVTQKIFLGFMFKLEKIGINSICDNYLLMVERRILTSPKFNEIYPLTRTYLSIHKARNDLDKMRRFCCEVFYFCGDLALPFFFAVLTSWNEVLPNAEHAKCLPLARALVHIVHLKVCNMDGYQSQPLKDLIKRFYGYDSEKMDSDEIFQELFKNYLRSPARTTSLPILLFCKNHSDLWVNEKIEKYLKPVVEKVRCENFKATCILLIGHLSRRFSSKAPINYIDGIKLWLRSLLNEENVPEVIKQSVYFCMKRLRER